jgi:hypothetical protein
MATSEIGALRVTLAMNAGEFQRGSRQAQQELSALEKRFAAAGAMIQQWGSALKLAAVVATTAAGYAIARLVEGLDELNKTSQKVGIPVEQLSGLKYAADLADVGLEGLSIGLKKMSKNLEEIASGDKTSAAARSLAALGVSATTSGGQLRSSEAILLDVADKFAGLEDGAGKTALAMAIFGKSGADLIPLLNMGSAAIAAAKVEAAAFGLVVSKQTAQAAEDFSDNLERLSGAAKGVGTVVLAETLPAMVSLTNGFIESAKQGGWVQSAAHAIGVALKTMASVAQAVGLVFKTAWAGFKFEALTAWEVIKGLPAMFELALRGAANAVAAGLERIVNIFVTGLAKIGYAVDALADAGLGDKITQSLTIDLGRLNTGEAEAKIKQMGDNINVLAEQMKTSIGEGVVGAVQNVGSMWSGWATSVEDAAPRIVKAQAPIIQSTKDINAAEQERQKLITQGIALVNEMRTPNEVQFKQLAALSEAYKAGKINAEQLAVAQQAATYTAASAYAGLASSVAGSLAQLFNKSKAVAIASAIVNTFEAVTKALAAYPPPLNYIAAAGALAAGMAQVANIRKTTSSGGGGGGGSAAPAASTAPAAAAPSTAVVIRGLSPGSMFSGESVREMVKAIEGHIADGGKVSFA